MHDAAQIHYEPEADVLSVELSREAKIDHAQEVGNVVVHFTKHNAPVLLEFLNATGFMAEAEKIIGKEGSSPSTAAAA